MRRVSSSYWNTDNFVQFSVFYQAPHHVYQPDNHSSILQCILAVIFSSEISNFACSFFFGRLKSANVLLAADRSSQASSPAHDISGVRAWTASRERQRATTDRTRPGVARPGPPWRVVSGQVDQLIAHPCAPARPVSSFLPA